MPNHIIPSEYVKFEPTAKELGLLRRRLMARGWSPEGTDLLVAYALHGKDREFAKYLIDHFVYRIGGSR